MDAFSCQDSHTPAARSPRQSGFPFSPAYLPPNRAAVPAGDVPRPEPCLIALAAPATARGCVYADFEAPVPRIDLPECPEGLAGVPAICRVTVANDALHAHVFAAEDEQRVVAVHGFHGDIPGLNLGR